MSKMSRVAHGRACRQEEMGVGCAYGPIYLCQCGHQEEERLGGSYAKERARGNTKLQVAVSRAHQVARAPEDFRRGAREPSWMAIQIALSPSVSSKPICPRHCERGRANARPMQAPRSNPV